MRISLISQIDSNYTTTKSVEELDDGFVPVRDFSAAQTTQLGLKLRISVEIKNLFKMKWPSSAFEFLTFVEMASLRF